MRLTLILVLAFVAVASIASADDRNFTDTRTVLIEARELDDGDSVTMKADLARAVEFSVWWQITESAPATRTMTFTFANRPQDAHYSMESDLGTTYPSSYTITTTSGIREFRMPPVEHVNIIWSNASGEASTDTVILFKQ